MNMKRNIITVLTVLALTFAVAQGAFAQAAENDYDFENEVNALNQAGVGDPTALLTKLSIEFSVDLVVLQDLYAQGYAPGQIWLALEIANASDTTLQDAILVAGATDGHGWGVLAQTLGIAPGSSEFHALKLSWGEHQGALVRAMKQEREQVANAYAYAKGEGNGANGKGGNEDKGAGNGGDNSGGNKGGGKN